MPRRFAAKVAQYQLVRDSRLLASYSPLTENGINCPTSGRLFAFPIPFETRLVGTGSFSIFRLPQANLKIQSGPGISLGPALEPRQLSVSSEAVDITLTDVDARVLGALVEKEITTPEYYPLSLNALVNACNQKSNRDPIMSLDEDAVRTSLRRLGEYYLARSASSDGRVAKYEHRLADTFNFHRHEIAILCVLLLRGPQTPGELRTRTDRMYSFEDLEGVHSALQLLMKREPPLVAVLPRQPGTKEVRYAHLLSGELKTPSADHHEEATPAPKFADAARVAHLEDEITTLKNEIATLKVQFAAFRKQFE
jgi:uncharacterized protein YceH (UPF0502 family)